MENWQEVVCSTGSPVTCSVMTWRYGMGRREGGLEGSGHMHNHAWFPLLYGRNQHNAAKIKKKKKSSVLGKATPILDAVGKQLKDRQFLTAVSR